MKSLLKLKVLIGKYKWHFLGAIITLAGLTATQLVVPNIIQEVIDEGIINKNADILIKAALLILGIGVARAVLGFVQRYLSEYISMNIAYDLRNKLFDHIQRMSFTFHDHTQTGQLMSRCTEDVRSMQFFIGTGSIELLQVIFILVGTTVLMLSANVQLALIAFIPMIPLVIITTDFGGRISKLFYAIDKSLGDLSSRLQENVTGVQVVRAFSRESHEIDRFKEKNRELWQARVTVVNEWSKIMPTTNFLVVISTILILFFGGKMVMNGELTIGQIVAFNSYVLILSMPIQHIAWYVNSAGEASAGTIRVFEILDEEPEIISKKSAFIPKKVKGQVEFKDVSFTYKGEKRPSLSGINFKAEPGQTIGLIGATGSGKTTLINMIPRFYDVDKGQVLVDDVDVRDYDLIELRRNIGLVLQTSLLFSSSIRENIAFGKPDASNEEIIKAAKAAQAHEFISLLPEGYDTVVGERGITLSGGQRQRVAIARALLVNPSILIMDDSTSSVDTETEHQIQQGLNELIEDRTTIIIAQRLSSVREADLILVIDDGEIKERGSHKELLKMNGLYKEIYDLQLLQQENFDEDLKSIGNTKEVNNG